MHQPTYESSGTCDLPPAVSPIGYDYCPAPLMGGFDPTRSDPQGGGGKGGVGGEDVVPGREGDRHAENESTDEQRKEGSERHPAEKADKVTGIATLGQLPDGEEKASAAGCEPEGEPRHSQITSTLKWLTDNYERAEGVCLPRCVLYTHYLDFCKKLNFVPAGAATFGKIIRQRFPKLTTRRLGTRGQSKYHYYGIGIKESSIYYHSVYTGKGLTRFSGTKVKTENSNRKYSLSSKTGTLLPEFPEASNLALPVTLDKEKVLTFLMMYKTHCQRILDTIISANFEEVQNFLLHFWQGMPDHLVSLLSSDVIIDLVTFCDSILYRVLADVLIPTSIQDLPDSLVMEIKLFTKQLPVWLDSSLEDAPTPLRVKKLEVVRTFLQNIRRQISFVHLAQTARSVLLSQESVTQMLRDLRRLDFDKICDQAGFADPVVANEGWQICHDYFQEFQTVLLKQASVESYTEWLDNVIDSCVLQTCKRSKVTFKEKAAEFLLQWTALGSLVMRDLTLCSAASFGSLHLVHLMLDEYVFLAMETQNLAGKEHEFRKAAQKYCKGSGDITVQLRSTDKKPQKGRKRAADNSDSEGSEDDVSPNCDGRSSSNVIKSYQHDYSRTAFCRPFHGGIREPINGDFQGETRIHHPEPESHHSFSPVKHFSPVGLAPNAYLPHAYADYLGSPNGGSLPVPQHFTEAHAPTFGASPYSATFNMVTTSPPYWTENRSPVGLTDPYSPYNKYHSSYTGYERPSSLYRGAYQDCLQRSAFDPARSFYSRPHDNFSGTHFPAASYHGYGPSCPDFSASSGQYARQEATVVQHQEDFYPANFAHSLQPLAAKTIVTPFH